MKQFGSQDMISELKKVLMKKPQKFMSKVDKKKWNYKKTLEQYMIEDNYNNFIKIIESFDIEIIYLNLEDENEELCDSIFTHDPSLVIDEGAIILNMTKKLRTPEVFEHINLYKSLNIPIIGRIVDNGKVEGGDCLWINKKTLLVGESYRTNLVGINQLKIILEKFNICVIPIKLPKLSNNKSCFHLMSIVSMLDNDLVIGYKNFITNELFEIFNRQKIKIIEIPQDEYLRSDTLAVNMLAISPRNIIALEGFPKTVNILDKHNCKISLFNGNDLCIKTEGGPTCLTRPILRI